MAKVLVVKGSCRKKSNSSALADVVAAEAKKKGHAVVVIDLAKLEIKPCTGCEACMKPKAKGCVVADDMQPLYPKVEEAEYIIYAAPIYWFNVGGQLKQFIDRCFAVAARRDADGKTLFAGKTLGAVLVYGDTDPFNSGCVNAIRAFQDTCSYCGATWAGAVYGSAYDAGTVGKDQELMAKAYAESIF